MGKLEEINNYCDSCPANLLVRSHDVQNLNMSNSKSIIARMYIADLLLSVNKETHGKSQIEECNSQKFSERAKQIVPMCLLDLTRASGLKVELVDDSTT